ncbi:hypothetical protein OBBRIDRAFT_830977 [Obba rivulosa]|uniref:Uncharacterized protein n=1 Tax=Obba rivulosa TaxID=1052685 RepID=A0A8E2DTA9_9APHY|nr:hypothetical protein OBBRIDRAFT_830977 [Obba rivulosa]
MSHLPSPPSSPQFEPYTASGLSIPPPLRLVDDSALRARRHSDRKAGKILGIVIMREDLTTTGTVGEQDQQDDSEDGFVQLRAAKILGSGRDSTTQRRPYPGWASRKRRPFTTFLRSGRRLEEEGEEGEDVPLIGLQMTDANGGPRAGKSSLRPVGTLFSALRKRKTAGSPERGDRAILTNTARMATVEYYGSLVSPFSGVPPTRPENTSLRRHKSTSESVRSARSSRSAREALTPATPASIRSAFSDISNASWTGYVSDNHDTHKSDGYGEKRASRKQARIRSRTKTLQILGSEAGGGISMEGLRSKSRK